MKVYSISEGRKILGDLVSRVMYRQETIALGKHGRADVLIIPFEQADAEVPLEQLAEQGGSFEFLHSEPELYSVDDLKVRYAA